MNEFYKGYMICESSRHGKCTSGNKKSSSIQVRHYAGVGSGYMLLKQLSFPVGDFKKRLTAWHKAKLFIDSIKKPEDHEAESK
jgi:hypothetical protein